MTCLTLSLAQDRLHLLKSNYQGEMEVENKWCRTKVISAINVSKQKGNGSTCDENFLSLLERKNLRKVFKVKKQLRPTIWVAGNQTYNFVFININYPVSNIWFNQHLSQLIDSISKTKQSIHKNCKHIYTVVF